MDRCVKANVTNMMCDEHSKSNRLFL